MKKKNFKTKLAALAASGLVVISGHSSSNQKIVLQTAKTPNESKPYTQILNDQENFNVNFTNILTSRETRNYLRLRMSEQSPVIINLDKNLDIREKQCIYKVVDYYNKLFDSINENYDFKIKEDKETIPKDSTIISIQNINDMENQWNIIGVTTYGDIQENELIVNPTISLDHSDLKEKSDSYLYSTILHEFTHCLGIADVYTKGPAKNTNTINKETFLNTINTYDEFPYLYPNDYAILQMLYSNEYSKHENYQDAVDVVNKKIENYTLEFYKKYYEKLVEKVYATNDLKNESIKEIIKWKAPLSENLNTCLLKITSDNTCEFIMYGKNGSILEKSTGEIMFVNGILFARNITLNNANNYNKNESEDLSLKFTLCFFKNQYGSLVVYDNIMPYGFEFIEKPISSNSKNIK